jgi:hypothetical protein
MTADVFSASTPGFAHGYGWNTMTEKKPLDQSTSSLRSLGGEPDSTPPSNTDTKMMPTVYIRKLPRTTGSDALRIMLLFAKDLVDVEFVHELAEDKGWASAIARFSTLAGARDAKEKLHGKTNAANDANMIVEVYPNGPPSSLRSRSNTVDNALQRQTSASTSPVPAPANGNASMQNSWFNGKFQSLEKVSPPSGAAALGNGDFTKLDSSNKGHFQGVFSPQSPIGPSFNDQARASGKSLITDNDDAGDDEELLKDTVAYAGKPTHAGPIPRRTTNPQMPVSRFAGLSLSTSGPMSPPTSSFSSPRSVAPLQSPTSALSGMSINSAMGNMTPHGPPSGYQIGGNQHFRHNYPPVNPADQNPPCNTLYVGNLPIDTSEDELKAMFSKQRGYKRLCFRTKQNGPMCFVEFEDVSHATRALNELYGQPLHNSVKGGIRLSFSKNPLGVRTGQNNSAGAQALPPQNIMPGMTNGLPTSQGGFSSATGPPPGLPPPSIAGAMSMNGSPMYGNGFNMNSNTLGNNFRNPMPGANPVGNANGNFSGMNDNYSPFMMGR